MWRRLQRCWNWVKDNPNYTGLAAIATTFVCMHIAPIAGAAMPFFLALACTGIVSFAALNIWFVKRSWHSFDGTRSPVVKGKWWNRCYKTCGVFIALAVSLYALAIFGLFLASVGAAQALMYTIILGPSLSNIFFTLTFVAMIVRLGMTWQVKKEIMQSPQQEIAGADMLPGYGPALGLRAQPFQASRFAAQNGTIPCAVPIDLTSGAPLHPWTNQPMPQPDGVPQGYIYVPACMDLPAGMNAHPRVVGTQVSGYMVPTQQLYAAPRPTTTTANIPNADEARAARADAAEARMARFQQGGIGNSG